MKYLTIFCLFSFLIYACGSESPGYDREPFLSKGNLAYVKSKIQEAFFQLGIKHTTLNEIPFERYSIEIPEEVKLEIDNTPSTNILCGYKERPGHYRRKWFFGRTQWIEKNFYIISIKEFTNECQIKLMKITVEAPNTNYKKWRQCNSIDDHDYREIQEKLKNYEQK
jgi:hypothetical protein